MTSIGGTPGITVIRRLAQLSPARVDLAGGSHDAHLDAFEQWIEALTRFLDVR
jgi:hypothetical protein